MMIHSLVIVPAPAQRRWFWPSATWCQVSWQRFEVRVPFVMLKNNVVLIVPCFEHHQSEYMLLSCHHTHSPQTFLCPSAFIVLLIMTSLTAKKRAISHSNAPKTVPTLHFYPKNMSWNREIMKSPSFPRLSCKNLQGKSPDPIEEIVWSKSLPWHVATWNVISAWNGRVLVPQKKWRFPPNLIDDMMIFDRFCGVFFSGEEPIKMEDDRSKPDFCWQHVQK